MKIIEALKELPLIEKKISKNKELIQKYASYASHIGPAFESEQEQRKEVESLVQSSNDLYVRYLKLRKALQKTNCEVEVTIEGLTLTINEWISYRESGTKILIPIFNNLNQNTASNHNEGVTVSIVTCYDEKKKNERIAQVEAISEKIDAQLEMVNATTDLVEEV